MYFKKSLIISSVKFTENCTCELLFYVKFFKFWVRVLVGVGSCVGLFMENSDSGLTLGLGLTKVYLNIPSVFMVDDTFRQNCEWWSAFYSTIAH